MARFAQVAQARRSRVGLRLLYGVAAAFCLLLLAQSVVVEAYHVPTGSMAPALLGHHRVCVCPRCGQEVVVGRHSSEAAGTRASNYRHAFCSNCGFCPLPVSKTREIPGDRITVNKGAFLTRAPSRWEILVFRFLNSLYIKRLLGLPGETILIRDGDLFVNGRLCRKTFAEACRMRVSLFDQARAPSDSGWVQRWEIDPPSSPDVGELALDGRWTPCALTYRHFSLDSGKCEPIRDEHAYNAGLAAHSECVHDFLVEAEIECAAGHGTLSLRLCDGGAWAEIVLPVGESRSVEAYTWPLGARDKVRKIADGASAIALKPGRRHRVEMALVDRRVGVALDGLLVLSADLPESAERIGVTRPFQAVADGAAVRLERFRLYRDVHYSQHGRNAVRGNAVQLGPDQYFMLGDNSTNSEDSRFWPGGGRVRFADFLGPIMRVQR